VAPLPQYPGVPTFTEAGLKDFTFNSWFAMVAPAGTPKPVIERLNEEVKKALNDTATRDKLFSLGVTPRGTSSSEFGVATRNQYELYRKLIQDKGIRAE
jgi:tripartite-type tricarboxylate transporter receptor subunit TctC